MAMKVADMEVRSVTINRVNFHCKDLDQFRSMPKAIQFRNSVYYKTSFHPGNSYASYVCEPDVVYEIEEDAVDLTLYDPKVLVSSDSETPEWVPLDILEKGLSDGTYGRDCTGIFKTSRNFDQSLN